MPTYQQLISADPYLFLILDLWTIGWCIIGYHMLVELWPEAPTTTWRLILLPFLGPLAWALLAYRQLRKARKAILAHYHLPDCGCCH